MEYQGEMLCSGYSHKMKLISTSYTPAMSIKTVSVFVSVPFVAVMINVPKGNPTISQCWAVSSHVAVYDFPSLVQVTVSVLESPEMMIEEIFLPPPPTMLKTLLIQPSPSLQCSRSSLPWAHRRSGTQSDRLLSHHRHKPLRQRSLQNCQTQAQRCRRTQRKGSLRC